ncbi:MAG: DUF6692 family protein [Gammaproteobacteria bacterium]
MVALLLPARRAGLVLAAVLGGLAACDQDDAPDDVIQHPQASGIARIASADEALANAQIARLDPATMNDAEIRKAVGTGPRCVFRYTSEGKPVLAVSSQPDGSPRVGVVKLNGYLVRLDAAADEEPARAGDTLRVIAGPIRMTISPDPREAAADGNGVQHRETDMVFEIGESLRVGYHGYVGCASNPPAGSPRS